MMIVTEKLLKEIKECCEKYGNKFLGLNFHAGGSESSSTDYVLYCVLEFVGKNDNILTYYLGEKKKQFINNFHAELDEIYENAE